MKVGVTARMVHWGIRLVSFAIVLGVVGFSDGGAARKVDQYAARKVIQSEGGSFYVFLLQNKEESACGNVGIVV